MTDLDKFVQDAIRTESKIDTVKTNPLVLREVVKAAINAGNLLDMLKKNIFYDKPIDPRAFEICANELVYAGENLSQKPDLTQRSSISINPRVFHSAIGIATEATEILESLDFYGNSVDVVNFFEEFGDIGWYEAIGIDELDGDFDDIFHKVINKLRARYPDKFNNDDAINRNLGVERAILEGTSKENT